MPSTLLTPPTKSTGTHLASAQKEKELENTMPFSFKKKKQQHFTLLTVESGFVIIIV